MLKVLSNEVLGKDLLSRSLGKRIFSIYQHSFRYSPSSAAMKALGFNGAVTPIRTSMGQSGDDTESAPHVQKSRRSCTPCVSMLKFCHTTCCETICCLGAWGPAETLHHITQSSFRFSPSSMPAKALEFYGRVTLVNTSMGQSAPYQKSR